MVGAVAPTAAECEPSLPLHDKLDKFILADPGPVSHKAALEYLRNDECSYISKQQMRKDSISGNSNMMLQASTIAFRYPGVPDWTLLDIGPQIGGVYLLPRNMQAISRYPKTIERRLASYDRCTRTCLTQPRV